jgi:GSH-dependent disulfide-bond oxidoreductase
MAIKNSATSGPRFERELEVGDHPLQLYSIGTPNGQKVTILLEELGLAYDAWGINIMEGENFSSGFLAVNPNEKIPALVDKEGPGGEEFTVFESGAILLYLVDKVPNSPLFPKDPAKRSKVIQWLMWQMGSAPYLGQFGACIWLRFFA